MNTYLALQRGVRQVYTDKDPIDKEDPLKSLPLLLPDDGTFTTGVIAENFGDPENEGRWTLGTSAQVSFTVRPSQWPNGLMLHVFGRPMEMAGQRALVTIHLNKADPIHLNFSKRGWTSFLIPIRLEQGEKQAVICQWFIENPFSPLSYGESEDHRQLGMLVGKLELRAASPMRSWPSLARLKGLFQRSVGRRKRRDGLLKQLILLGAGGHAKVVIELFREANEFDIVGCLDQTQSGFVGGVPILGDDSLLSSLRKKGVTHAFVAVGDNTIRANLGKKLCAEGFTLANALAGSARISPSAQLGTGVAIMHGVVINAESVIADLVILNTNATIDHDCRLGLAAHIAPGAVLTGNVKVGTIALIGAGSCILPGVSIGDRAIVGAGAVVTKAVSADSISWGVPARPKLTRP